MWLYKQAECYQSRVVTSYLLKPPTLTIDDLMGQKGKANFFKCRMQNFGLEQLFEPPVMS